MTLKTYGKDPEQLDAIIPIFQMVLADYTFDKIESAFAFYLKHNSEMPAPGDIATIIDRGNKPQFQNSVYIATLKKEPEQRDSDDWQYIREYENFVKTGKY